MYHAKVTAETTPQEFYDEIAKCYEAGNFPAIVETSDAKSCMYRLQVNGKDGEKECRACLIGSFIPDAEYSEGMEGKGAKAISLILETVTFPSFLFQNYNNEDHGTKMLMTALQDLHDHWDWKRQKTEFLKGVREVMQAYGHTVASKA